LKTSKIRLFGAESFTIICTLVHLFPIYLIVTMSLKSKNDFLYNIFGLPRQIMFGNIADAWNTMHYMRAFLNSVVITFSALIVIIVFGSAAGFALARANRARYHVLYLFFLSGLMIPYQMLMVTEYKLLDFLRLIHTQPGLILIYAAINLPLSIFLFTGFMKGIPVELDESALVEGCSLFQTFTRVIFPLLLPVISTAIILNAVFIWNEFLLPLVFLSGEENRTLMTALYVFRIQEYVTDWTKLSAGMLLTIIPLVTLFVFFQRYFIQGMISGALKG
jgi:raffinose/stachyose/melibiose transport system permease protein